MAIMWKNKTIEKNWRAARKFAERNNDLSHGRLMDYAEGIIGQKRPTSIAPRFVAIGGEGDCYCGHKNCKHTERLTLEINGRLPDPTGIQLGSDCEGHFLYIFEGLTHRNFKIKRQPPSEREIQSRLEDIAIQLSELPEKAIKILQKEGFDLNGEIAAGAVKELLKSIYKKDTAGISRKLDYSFAKQMFDWGIEHKTQAENYPNIFRIISKLENGSKIFLTPKEVAAYLLFYWQERQLDPKEIQPLRNEIQYLRTATSTWKTPFNPNPAVKTEKVYDRARKETFSLDELLDEKRGGITKAQINAIEEATNVKETRNIHNQVVLDTYGISWDSTLEYLKETFDKQKRTYRQARKQGIKKPELKWDRDSHSALKQFFESAEEKCRTNNIGIVDYILQFIRADKARETIDNLFVAGQKLKLALTTKNDAVYKTAYKSAEPEYAKDLERIANAAVEPGKPPKKTRESLKEAGISARKFNEAQEKIRESIKYGIIPTKYLQDGTLQKMRKAVEGFEERPDIAESIDRLAYLEKSFAGLKLKFTLDGKTPFATENYAGKKYFSKEQASVVERIMDALPKELKELSEKDEKDYRKTEKFYKNHDVYCGKFYEDDKKQLYLAEFWKEKTAEPRTGSIAHLPVGWAKEQAAILEEYKPVQALRKEITYLRAIAETNGQNTHEWDAVLQNPRARLMPSTVQEIKNLYKLWQATNMSQRI